MIPVLALIGRPNVGKSTLFNRLTRSRDAIVANLSGLTRDRQYGEGEFNDRKFIVIDTGGLTGDEEGIDAAMAEQSFQAIEEADQVLFVVDAKSGLTGVDEEIAARIRTSGKPCAVVINKVDGLDQNLVPSDFYAMGMEQMYLTAASQNRGIKTLLDTVLEQFPVLEHLDQDLQQGTRIAIIGRPNVGKSTLVNRLLGEDRVVVFDQPGTTRDSVYIPYERNEKPYTLIDTAGVRRRKNVKQAVEKFSIVKTLKAIEDANVVIIVVDAREGLVDQDLHMIGFAIDAGRAIVIAVNKWDGMKVDEKNRVRAELDRRLVFLNYVKIHFISAKHGSGVGDLYKSVDAAYDSAMARWTPNQLTQLLQDCVSEHQPPVVKGRRTKLRYAHQGGSNPPVVVVHGNKTDDLPASYKKFLENTFRKVLKVTGSPIRFEFKTSENPYTADTKNLSEKQIIRRRRLKKNKEIKADRKFKGLPAGKKRR